MPTESIPLSSPTKKDDAAGSRQQHVPRANESAGGAEGTVKWKQGGLLDRQGGWLRSGRQRSAEGCNERGNGEAKEEGRAKDASTEEVRCCKGGGNGRKRKANRGE